MIHRYTHKDAGYEHLLTRREVAFGYDCSAPGCDGQMGAVGGPKDEQKLRARSAEHWGWVLDSKDSTRQYCPEHKGRAC